MTDVAVLKVALQDAIDQGLPRHIQDEIADQIVEAEGGKKEPPGHVPVLPWIDAGVSLGTDILGGIIGGYAGIGTGITNAIGITDYPAAEAVRNVQDFISIDPFTRHGEAKKDLFMGGMKKAGDATNYSLSGLVGLASIPWGAEAAAENVREVQDTGISEFLGETGYKYGGPALGAVGKATPMAVLSGAGLSAARTPGAVAGSDMGALNSTIAKPKITGLTNKDRTYLENRGANVRDPSPDNVGALNRTLAAETEREAARVAALERAGLEPTRAQVSRSADDFQLQQESYKTSGEVRAALETQEGILSSNFDRAIARTGGQRSTSGSPVTNEIVGRSLALDEQITELYRMADDAAAGVKNVKLEGLVQALDDNIGANTISKGLVAAIRGNLKKRGILDAQGRVTGRIDVKTAEQIRKDINSYYNSTSDFGRGLIRELKEALDNDVFVVAGEDIYLASRAAKTTFERGLSKAKIHKFDKNDRSLVRDILENKVNPDTLINDVVFSKKRTAAEIQQLKDYLNQTQSGRSAFNDLRAQTLDEIQTRAFQGPIDEAGIAKITRASLERAMKSIGREKMEVLFTPEEMSLIDNIVEVTKIREPVAGTFLGKGPSAQAVKELQLGLMKHPILRTLYNVVNDRLKSRGVLAGQASEAGVLGTRRAVTGDTATALGVGALTEAMQ